MRRLVAALVLLVTLGAITPVGSARDSADSQKPNLLFVLTDDQRPDTLSVMPATRTHFDVTFRTAIVTTPECCPSRASILTGRYARDTGVTNNALGDELRDEEPDALPVWLQQQGYYTGFIGKYLNKYGTDDPVPPGWDEFYALTWNPDGSYLGDFWFNFTLRQQAPDEPSHLVTYPNEGFPDAYATRVFGDLAYRFINRAHDSAYNPMGKPWALFLWPNAPNGPEIEPGYADHYIPPWRRRPSFMEADMSDKPPEVRRSRFRRPRDFPFEEVRARQLRMLISVDDAVEQTFDIIWEHGEQEKTWGVFFSDNGRSWGEHHLDRKLHAFEESIRVPLRFYVPGIDRASIGGLAAAVDIAPTLLDLAGGQSREEFDGRSLLPVALGEEGTGRRDILIEAWSSIRWKGVRNNRWTYVQWPSGNEELYNLMHDPFQLRNIAHLNRFRILAFRRALARLEGS